MTSTADTLNAELVQQTELFNKLRIENSDPVALEESRKRLGEIKRELAALKPGGKDAKKRERLLLKTPKVRLRSCPATAPSSNLPAFC
jgi:histidyl-tRNA synthetase